MLLDVWTRSSRKPALLKRITKRRIIGRLSGTQYPMADPDCGMSEMRKRHEVLIIQMSVAGRDGALKWISLTLLDDNGRPDKSYVMSRVEASADATRTFRIDRSAMRAAPARRLFDFDRAEVRSAADDALLEVASHIAAAPGKRVTVEGHTDGKGTTRRSAKDARRRYAPRLSRAGLPERHSSPTGLEKSRPIAPNAHVDGSDDPEGRAKNRRVEVVINTCS